MECKILPAECGTCQDNERCRPGSVDDVCVKEECAELAAGELLVGNIFAVGNNSQVINDTTSDENIFTCSLLSDIGTVLGEGCIYSCTIEQSAADPR